jgi:tetratricopeptide (TPR) repeat protein
MHFYIYLQFKPNLSFTCIILSCLLIFIPLVKGYLRKGASLMAIKEFSRASDCYQKALEIDPNCQEAVDAYRK